mmetsp:Transcript_32993/g.24292  ORF Transcript_32993/g.24292 Transcript_32993/m.24292 type:complete len:93 (+) Transcript_32993:115-393(+)
MDEGGLVVFFNKKTDINRFYIDSGTGDNLPKVEFGAGHMGDEKDPFEDSLEDALCVFKSSGGKDSDILKENEGQILFYVDLENEQFIDRLDN